MPSTRSTLIRRDLTRPQQQYLEKASRLFDSLKVDPPDDAGCITVVAYNGDEPVGEFYVDGWGNCTTLWT